MLKPYFLLFIVCACLYVIAYGVNEEEYCEPGFDAEYREQESADPYREQELPEGFEDGKSNPTLLMHTFYPMFYKHNLLACFTKLHCFTIKTWLDSHPLIAIIIP